MDNITVMKIKNKNFSFSKPLLAFSITLLLLLSTMSFITWKYIVKNIEKLKQNKVYNKDEKNILNRLYILNYIIFVICVLPLLLLFSIIYKPMPRFK